MDLLFGDLKDTGKEVGKRRTVADRMERMEGGNWAGGQVCGRRVGDSDAKAEAQATTERVQQLLEAHEMSQAAAAARGSAGLRRHLGQAAVHPGSAGVGAGPGSGAAGAVAGAGGGGGLAAGSVV